VVADRPDFVTIHHFASEFKQSARHCSHRYLIQQQVERAQAMLAHAALSLSEIESFAMW
jgi:hypothetical protein